MRLPFPLQPAHRAGRAHGPRLFALISSWPVGKHQLSNLTPAAPQHTPASPCLPCRLVSRAVKTPRRRPQTTMRHRSYPSALDGGAL